LFSNLYRLEAVKYEKSFCSFQSLATLQPYGHVDNYLVLVYCRKLFMDHHPRYSKKHTFFSYVGVRVQLYLLFHNLFFLFFLWMFFYRKEFTITMKRTEMSCNMPFKEQTVHTLCGAPTRFVSGTFFDFS
jgi:hypothetical protein